MGVQSVGVVRELQAGATVTPALDIGGVLSIACTFCKVPRGQECRKANGDPTKPHAARLAAAPPIVEAHVGDLVLVRYRGEHVAQLVEIGTVLTVRFWRPSAQVFASPRLLEREAVIGLAPDDARTAMASEQLDLEGREAKRKYLTDPAYRARIDKAVKDATGETFDPYPGEGVPPVLAPDIAEGRGPFDPGQDTSDPSPTTPPAPPDPWFTSDSAETTAPPKGW